MRHPRERPEFRVKLYISNLVSYIPCITLGWKPGYRGETSEWRV
jgi:hypothetical protein